MKVLSWCSLLLALAACGPSRPERRVPPPPSTPRTWGEGTAGPAREVLVQHCGRCHRSDLPTAVPGALAVFDLTQEHWYLTLSEEQLGSLLRRMRGNAEVATEDLAAVEAFAAAARP